jgi:drug/metabolite transporter (DMT)-like permease
VLHESLTWSIGVGAVLVLACVAIVVRRESVPADVKAVPVAETG